MNQALLENPKFLEVEIDEYKLIAKLCRLSFFEFVKEFWDTVIPETYEDNWHIAYLCYELQMAMERVFAGLPREDDIIINISPGSTKSTIVSVMLPAWCWIKMPTCRILGGSHGSKLSTELSRKNRQVVKSEKYRRCFPEIQLSRDQDAKSHFVNTYGGDRYAAGVGGLITGFHGHLLLIDDPLDPQSAVSEAELATANKWMDETLATRKVDKEITLTVLIMQRLHQDDCTANMLAKTKNIRHICLPAEVSDRVQPLHLKSFYKDGLMDPKRLNYKVLAENKLKLGQYGYAGQFSQWPVPPGGGMFKVNRITIDIPPTKWEHIQGETIYPGRIRSWDNAATKDAGCFSAGVKVGLDTKGRVWILNVVRGQWDTDVREDTMKKTAVMDGRPVNILLEQEPGSGGKHQAQSQSRNLHGFHVIIERPSGDKVYRADPFSVQVNNGNVFMAPGPWNEDFLDELRFFPLSKFKDQVDAAAAGYNELVSGYQRAGALE